MPSGSSIVIIGAGPAGCATAIRAARLPGVKVQVVEKRSFESLLASRDTARAYPMVLSPRGLKMLDQLSLDLPSTREPFHGIEFSSGTTLRFTDPRACRLVSRTQLCLDLLRAAAQEPRISLHFNTVPDALDCRSRRITFRHSDPAAASDASSRVLESLQHEVASPSHAHPEVDELALASHGAADAHLSEASTFLDSALHKATNANAHNAERHASPSVDAEMHEASSPSTSASHGGHAHGGHEASHAYHGAAGGISSNEAVGMSAALAVLSRSEPSLPNEVHYDLLVGADGWHSQIRTWLHNARQLSVLVTNASPNSGYKTLNDIRIPSNMENAGLAAAAPDVEPRQKLFFVESVDKSVRMRFVLWRSDRDHVCGFVPTSEAAAALAQPMSEEQLRGIFGDALPQWFLGQVVDQLNAQELSTFGAIVCCSKFHGDGGVVLLGDAAHAVTSKLGQGCNMALESARLLGDLMEECIVREPECQIADALPRRFTEERQRDVHALQQLERMTCLVDADDDMVREWGVGALEVLHSKLTMGSAMIVGLAQHKLMPQRFSTLPFFAKLYDGNVPYSNVLAYATRLSNVMYGTLGLITLSGSWSLLQVLTNKSP